MITTNQQPIAVLIAGDPTLPSFSNLESSEDDTSKDIQHAGHSPAPLESGLDNQGLVASPKRLKRYSLAFALTTFGYGPAFGSAGTYYTYQIQQIAFLIGSNPGQPAGSGCLSLELPCRVPFGSRDVNLTSFLLYLNALIFALSGAFVLIVCGWGDYLTYKREQYILLLVIFGTLALPAAGITSLTLTNFNALAALYITINIIGSVTSAWQNIFIPYTMQKAAPIEVLSASARQEALDKITGTESKVLRQKREMEGVKISVWGNNALYLGTTIFFAITIGLSYINANTQINAGLYVTTASGIVCIACALGGWRFLPVPSTKSLDHGQSFWLLPFKTFANLWRGVARYPQAFKFLIAYTIYTDSALTFGTVLTNLFNLSVRPSLVEFTAWSMVGCGASIVSGTIFLFLFPRLNITLRQWTLAAYMLITLLSVWCLLGMSDRIPIGFKHRAEFYLFQIFQNMAGSVLLPVFRVLFSEVFPKGSEIQYFGFQMVLSSGTAWIPQIINGPIVDSTNNPRLPAVISLVAYLVAIGLVWWMDDDMGIATIREEEVKRLQEEGL